MVHTPSPQIAHAAVAELGYLLDGVPEARYAAVLEEVLAANRIVLHGVGREGLMLRALTMRLMHLGFDAHVLGDMTAPPVRTGDLLIVSAGPGHFASVRALQEIARSAGARVLVITAVRDGINPNAADVVVTLPGPTLSPDLQVSGSALLMGSLFEIVQLVFYDVIARQLSERLERPLRETIERHTNLE